MKNNKSFNKSFNKSSLFILGSIIIGSIIICMLFYNKKIIHKNIENFKEYLNNDENKKNNENKVKQGSNSLSNSFSNTLTKPLKQE